MICRLVTLSFPPFIVIHVNEACCELNGYAANEMLGLPLSKFFGKDHQEKLQDSVTALHDQLVPIATKDEPTDHPRKCFAKVFLVGPESSEASSDPEKEGEQVDEDDDDTSSAVVQNNDTELYVTHYGVELEPVSSDCDMGGNNPRSDIHLVSSEMSTFCGILG